MKKAWVLSYPLSAQRRLIRLGGCPGWSESSLGAQLLCWFCHVAAHLIQSWKKLIIIHSCNRNKFLDGATDVRVNTFFWCTSSRESLTLFIVCNSRYATEVDVDFVRKSVRAIGRCAIKVEPAAERCVSTLLDLIQTKVNYVVQEAIVVIKVLFTILLKVLF